jgi:hypothetical protein
MSNTVVTSTTMALNTETDLVTTAATADTADLAETFDITPTKQDMKCLIMIRNVSAINGSVIISIAAGDFWGAGSAITGTVAQGKVGLFEVDSALVKKSTGKISVTVTPATGKKLVTDHTLSMAAIQLL